MSAPIPAMANSPTVQRITRLYKQTNKTTKDYHFNFLYETALNKMPWYTFIWNLSVKDTLPFFPLSETSLFRSWSSIRK